MIETNSNPHFKTSDQNFTSENGPQIRSDRLESVSPLHKDRRNNLTKEVRAAITLL